MDNGRFEIVRSIQQLNSDGFIYETIEWGYEDLDDALNRLKFLSKEHNLELHSEICIIGRYFPEDFDNTNQ